jgi:hypothetical protein
MSENKNTETKIIAIEGRSSGAKFSTVFIWLLAILIGIVIGSVFAPNIPFIGNKEIKKLENENKELQIQIDNRNQNIILLERQHDTLVFKYENLKDSVVYKDSIITRITHEIDSINSMVAQQDSIIKNIYDERYKDINNVSNMDINERIRFFTDYFRSRIRPKSD